MKGRDTGGMVMMAKSGSGPGFYEEDEPVEKITAIFEAGAKGVTAPPPKAAGQIVQSRTFILVTPTFQAVTELASQRSEFVQA
jgi:hypothetical protein